MSSIRKQSIVSSFVVYFGFALGFFNTYLFTKEGGFTKEEYGLTGTFIAIANIMFAVANLGMSAYVSKFFPYYNSRLTPRKNDQLTWALLIATFGFGIVLVAGILFKNVLFNRIFDNSPQLLHYYKWLFPFGFGLTLFLVLEAYAWQQRQAVLSNFLKEVLFRFFITILIALTFFGVIRSFSTFISLYAFLYLAIALLLIVALYRNHQLHFTLTVSNVTQRFKKKIITLCSFVWGGSLVYNIAAVFDTIVIAAVFPNGMSYVGIFTLAQNMSSLIQAPQRGIVSASMGPLSKAWKEKDYKKIDVIYHRSSINQLLFSCGMFALIWLNFEDGVQTFGLQEDYLTAKWVFFFLGLTRIIDMGTGLNREIVSTSTFWRFEFVTGLALLALSLPLNFILTKQLGITGPAVSNLIAFTVYNAIRYVFLWKKFGMQPFTIKSLLTLVWTATGYFLCYILFNQYSGFGWIMLRSATFILFFIAGLRMFNLSPDAVPVWQTVKKRLRF